MSDTNNNVQLWDAKLHARLHDPAEKALVLLRDPSGHEGGTSRELHRRLFANGVDEATKNAVKRADWWASAADRPQFPRASKDGPYAKWTQVRFDESPVLRHPLSGEALDLREQGGLKDTDFNQIKQQSLAHHKRIIDAVGNDDDRRRLAIALWRFGPELRAEDDTAHLGELWRLLPADTRVPDHSIWDHLDLTSAFAGAFAADANSDCALLSVSLGPVQEFIAEARTASDLWAGSHLLSRMAWEAMKVIAAALGPDAILFPRLRGVAQVDLWLVDELELPDFLFQDQPWRQAGKTDANPLFSAALPNRFLAVVPADQAQELGERITAVVRDWARNQTREAFRRVLHEAKVDDRENLHGYEQIDEQLTGFPEVHWSAVPYSRLIETDDQQKVTGTDALAQCLAPFFETAANERPGFLGTHAWRLLGKAVDVDGVRFYRPNPGLLYPAVYQLAERIQAVAKTQRPFAALEQKGYRCSLTATSEWLTDDPEQLGWPPGERNKQGTLWTRVAESRPAWARKGEHLGALATLKRLWPTLYVDEIAGVLGDSPSRFVVSTHAMALAPALKELGQNPIHLDASLRAEIKQCDRTALPRKLVVKELHNHPDGDLIARIPDWLDQQHEAGEARQALAEKTIKKVFGKKPEAYYAMILMDGDHMGKWLSGDPDFAIRYLDAFHPNIRNSVENRFKDNPALEAFVQGKRALSPSRHLAISGALGDFSSVIAREVVEEQHMGRVLYAGGDDLMAMVATSDLLGMMAALREAYSGQSLEGQPGEGSRFSKGYYRRKKRLYLTMGNKATASMGAVVAHHQAPLGSVIRALRAAEQRAKNEGNRNAYSIQIVKRSGGAVTLTLPWVLANRADGMPSTIQCLRELSQSLQKDNGASRRAAYNVNAWLHDLPAPGALGEAAYRTMMKTLLHHQFARQGLEKKGQPIHSRRLAQLCGARCLSEDAERLESFLSTAEFMARECRSVA